MNYWSVMTTLVWSGGNSSAMSTSAVTNTPIYHLPAPPTATELIATLRAYGLTEQMMTPDMLQTIEEIADDLSHGPTAPDSSRVGNRSPRRRAA
jgi:hypothetical protein